MDTVLSAHELVIDGKFTRTNIMVHGFGHTKGATIRTLTDGFISVCAIRGLTDVDVGTEITRCFPNEEVIITDQPGELVRCAERMTHQEIGDSTAAANAAKTFTLPDAIVRMTELASHGQFDLFDGDEIIIYVHGLGKDLFRLCAGRYGDGQVMMCLGEAWPNVGMPAGTGLLISPDYTKRKREPIKGVAIS